MNIEEIKNYIARIQTTKIDDLNIEEYIDFTLKVMNDFDKKESKSYELLLQEYLYLTIFFHKYASKQFEIKVAANFSNNIPNNYYNNGSISYAATPMAITKNPSIWNAYAVLHEMRHAVQDFSYTKGLTDILSIEPLTILMLKERLYQQGNQEMYDHNHNKFIFENDANLVTDGYLMDFIAKYCPNNHSFLENIRLRNQREKTNFSSMISENSNLTRFEFDNKVDSTTLPVFYEIDRYLKSINIDAKLIKQCPLLELIYHKDGKRKTYVELMKDKERLLLDNKGKKTQVKRSSLFDYKEESIEATLHINSIYEGIIKSDPLLHIEDLLKNNRISDIEDILTSCPQLLEVYKNELRNLFVSYLSMENYSKLSKLFSTLGNNYLKDSLDKRYERIVRLDIQNILGIVIDYHISPERDQIKSTESLDAEAQQILSKLQEKVMIGELTEKRCLEYQKAILEMYDKYKQLSKTNAKSNEPIKEQQNIYSSHASANFSKLIHDIESWYKKRYHYDDGDDDDKLFIDDEIEARIIFANQLLSKGYSIEMIQNNLEELYQQELHQVENLEHENVERIGRLK